MPLLSVEFLPLGVWAAAFVLVIARLSFIVFLMPGIGEQVIPARVRLVLILALAMALYSSGIEISVPFEPFSGYLLALITEVFIGFILGVSLRLVIWLLSIAGAVIAQSIGLAQFLGVALEHEAQTITANLLSMAGAVILLTANYHVEVFVALIDLYAEVPVGLVSSLDQAFFIEGIYTAFGIAVSLAWPFVAVNLIYNICLGFINKALPQLMVAFVGAPFMVGAGMFLLAVSIVSFLMAWKAMVPDLVGWL
ncbi:MAG: flagellar biosynthetic protein FliR [Hyphomonas sp.]